MRDPREPGFYWVRYPDDDSEPVVARWSGESWLVPGYENEWIESSPPVLSERLEPPS